MNTTNDINPATGRNFRSFELTNLERYVQLLTEPKMKEWSANISMKLRSLQLTYTELMNKPEAERTEADVQQLADIEAHCPEAVVAYQQTDHEAYMTERKAINEKIRPSKPATTPTVAEAPTSTDDVTQQVREKLAAARAEVLFLEAVLAKLEAL